MLIISSRYKIPKDYEDNFEKAFLTFKFQLIYCPIEKKMRHFNELKNSQYPEIEMHTDLRFLGELIVEIESLRIKRISFLEKSTQLQKKSTRNQRGIDMIEFTISMKGSISLIVTIIRFPIPFLKVFEKSR